ncbi:uncharacterized protein BCR38DRAFT_482434 [Pseudomassariella vexata]|uniref:Uncharacterized protein n=1 Tax=Pseudomassariella vexata TaxID=1141098 RepID=A0A1Y2EBM3_9PEZI|nr:uncharacterized protein BCR38DRAFT_482434 [Pseudomassariella vexata]ORY68958.1 hypothetical protein BCR38DRAFT_482434 [Pseudomassariella vexata]
MAQKKPKSEVVSSKQDDSSATTEAAKPLGGYRNLDPDVDLSKEQHEALAQDNDLVRRVESVVNAKGDFKTAPKPSKATKYRTYYQNIWGQNDREVVRGATSAKEYWRQWLKAHPPRGDVGKIVDIIATKYQPRKAPSANQGYRDIYHKLEKLITQDDNPKNTAGHMNIDMPTFEEIEAARCVGSANEGGGILPQELQV